MRRDELPEESEIVAQTRRWVQDIVVGHNFCPFAHKPVRNDVIRYSVSYADNERRLVDDLIDELVLLRDADPSVVETSIFITPCCFDDFQGYNAFLDVVDMIIDQLLLNGVIQVASFHPDYCFGDLDADDVRNYTNRSPYPMFHLIRESDIERARATYPDVERIPEDNMALLEKMGLDAIQTQLRRCLKQDDEDGTGRG